MSTMVDVNGARSLEGLTSTMVEAELGAGPAVGSTVWGITRSTVVGRCVSPERVNGMDLAAQATTALDGLSEGLDHQPEILTVVELLAKSPDLRNKFDMMSEDVRDLVLQAGVAALFHSYKRGKVEQELRRRAEAN